MFKWNCFISLYAFNRIPFTFKYSNANAKKTNLNLIQNNICFRPNIIHTSMYWSQAYITGIIKTPPPPPKYTTDEIPLQYNKPMWLTYLNYLSYIYWTESSLLLIFYEFQLSCYMQTVIFYSSCLWRFWELSGRTRPIRADPPSRSISRPVFKITRVHQTLYSKW